MATPTSASGTSTPAAASICARVDDAEFLWHCGREQSGLLLALVAVAARARLENPSGHGDRLVFETYLRQQHDWTISVEYRGQQWDTDHLFYTWMRCELVHVAGLPMDLVIDDGLTEPGGLAIRAGGAPEHVLRLSPGWFTFFCHAATDGLS